MKLPKFLVMVELVVLLTLAVRAGGGQTNIASISPPQMLDATYAVGSWIWEAHTEDEQTCRVLKTFEIPDSAHVLKAQFRVTADNSYILYVNGQEIGRGAEWRELTQYDIAPVLHPGRNVLAIEGFNSYGAAGIAAGLMIQLDRGRVIEIGSDQNWYIVPNDEPRWTTRTRPDVRWSHAHIEVAFLHGIRSAKPMYINLANAVQPVIVAFWQTGWFQIALISICLIVVLICFSLMSQLVLYSKAQDVVQRERARIARDIHDDLTAGLTQLVLQGEVAKNGALTDPQTFSQIDQICDQARTLMRGMNEIIWAVNPQRDTLKDFISYLCRYAQTFLESSTISCRFDVEAEVPTMYCDIGIRRNLFLAVKEALNNAVRYSEATELYLRIHHSDGALTVVVEDNGKGFDTLVSKPDRNGLVNMRQRAIEAEGTCRITSRPGAGCRIEFVVPLENLKPYRSRWLNLKYLRPRFPSAKAGQSSASANHSNQPKEQ